MARPSEVGLQSLPQLRLAARARASQDAALPADGLLDPVVLGAIGLLILNDHVLKAPLPGVVTGKLSDFAGLAFFPVLLVGAWELARAAMGRWRGPSARAIGVAIGLTGIAFTLVKTTPVAAEGFGWVLGLAQWLLALPVRLLAGTSLPSVAPTVVLVDPTDLVAVVALAVPLGLGIRRAQAAAR